MTQPSDLMGALAAHEKLMTWWSGFLADCARRRTMRENKLSARSIKGHQTARSRRMERHVRVWGDGFQRREK